MEKHIKKKRGPVKRLTAFAAALSLVCLLVACRNGGNIRFQTRHMSELRKHISAIVLRTLNQNWPVLS